MTTTPEPIGAPRHADPDGGHDAHDWLDQDAGPVVRPYAVTGGRARPATTGIGLLTFIEANYSPDADVATLQPEHRTILQITRTAHTLADVASELDLPVGVARVLVGDLVHTRLVTVFESETSVRPPDEPILRAVIDGLRAL